MPALLTLTTDFGRRDAYVAAMKGVMLGIAPDVRLVDLTHEIGAQDIMEAAFFLKNAVFHFPAGTVHLIVVDPGVGSDRRALALRKDGHFFVGPDNGVFSLLFDGEAPEAIVELTRPEFWREGSPSPTFHGRDIFAPVAAHLAAGAALEAVGPPVEQLQQLRWGLPIADAQGIRGWVVHIDHFGNCITNIPRPLVAEHAGERPIRSYAGSTIFEGLHRTYSDVEQNQPLILFGSSGLLEIAVNSGNAADLLSIRRGDPVDLIFIDRS